MRQVTVAMEAIVKEEPGQWHNFQDYDTNTERGTA